MNKNEKTHSPTPTPANLPPEHPMQELIDMLNRLLTDPSLDATYTEETNDDDAE